jgi:hypothetical protein
MAFLRQELKSFSRACEVLLSDTFERPLNEEEQGLIRYYLSELDERFGQNARNSTHRHPPNAPEQWGKTRLNLHTKRLQLEPGILNAVVIGEFELGAAQTQFAALLDEAVRSGVAKVLIDGQRITGNPNGFERFLYGEFAAWATLDIMKQHNIRLKFAYVIHEPLRDHDRFGETVAVNRGMDVKTFEDAHDAMEWLNA